MSRFFAVSAVICVLLYLTALLMGHLASYQFTTAEHMLVGLTAAILNVALHCLIFAIFTGSGKDTRLLVQDLKLNEKYIKRTKVFKRTIFPPALYAIGLILITTSFGGALNLYLSSEWVRYGHLFAAWFTFFYSAKVMWAETQAVAENSAIIESLNKEAAAKIGGPINTGDLPELPDGSVLEWETHVYAFGKFLCFMGYNVWLPFIYLRYIVGWLKTPFWLFLIVSLVCLVGWVLFALALLKPSPTAWGIAFSELDSSNTSIFFSTSSSL